jgi:hypothetical protein
MKIMTTTKPANIVTEIGGYSLQIRYLLMLVNSKPISIAVNLTFCILSELEKAICTIDKTKSRWNETRL